MPLAYKKLEQTQQRDNELMKATFSSVCFFDALNSPLAMRDPINVLARDLIGHDRTETAVAGE